MLRMSDLWLLTTEEVLALLAGIDHLARPGASPAQGGPGGYRADLSAEAYRRIRDAGLRELHLKLQAFAMRRDEGVG